MTDPFADLESQSDADVVRALALLGIQSLSMRVVAHTPEYRFAQHLIKRFRLIDTSKIEVAV